MKRRPISEETPEKLQTLRRKIDALDEKLVTLLNERSVCSVQIGKLKQEIGLAIHDPERERQIVQRIGRASKGPLSAVALARLFERILDESRRLERMSQSGTESSKRREEDR